MAAALSAVAAPAVHFDYSLKCFVSNGRVLPGLHSVLKTLFYPNYSYNAMYNRSQVNVSIPQTNHGKQRRRSRVRMPVWVARRSQQYTQAGIGSAAAASSSSSDRLPYGHQAAMRAGSALDAELKQSINLAIQYSLPWNVFCDPRQSIFDELLNHVSRPVKATIMHIARNLSASARAAWTMMKEYELKPIGAQVLCGDGADWKLATFADIICESPDQQTHVILEIKLNYRHRMISSGHQMLPPFEAWTDCAQNQMILQAAATAVLYYKHYHRSPFTGALAVVIDNLMPKGYDVIYVAGDTLRKVRDVFDELVVLEAAEGMKKQARRIVREEAKIAKRAADAESVANKKGAKRARKTEQKK